MVVNDKEENDLLFTIENNVLKGKVKPYDIAYTNLGQMLFDTLKSNPNIVGPTEALNNKSLTFDEVLDRAIKCALWMQKQGLKKGDVIALSTHNHLNCFIPCLASLFIGVIFNPWNYEMTVSLARHFMNVSEPKMIFANESSSRVVMEMLKVEDYSVKVVCFGDFPGTMPFSEVLEGHEKSEVDSFRCTEIDDPNTVASILFSSGTTGVPKGVQVSHQAYLISLSSAFAPSNLTMMWFSTLYWISGTTFSIWSIVSCTKNILTPTFSEQTACELIQKFKVSWLMLSTSMANCFARYDGLSNYDLSSLEKLLVGGACLKQDSQDMLKKHLPNTLILQAYGMTELGGVPISQLKDTSSGSCGVVNANCQVKFVDPETGVVVGCNQNGEMYVKCPSMTTGYYKNPEATKEIIDEDGWLHTGDLGYFNEKGEIFIVDRLKEIIKYKGYQVAPSMIENLLQTHPAVLEAAVVGIPHITDDSIPIAFVSKVPNKEVTSQELIDMVADSLMEYYHLRGGVKFMPSLPHTHSGKISRKELKAMAKNLATY